MNLTNSSEPMGAESGATYKSEPSEMMYYHAPATDSINQSTDGFLSSLLNDEDLHLMDMAMNDSKYKFLTLYYHDPLSRERVRERNNKKIFKLFNIKISFYYKNKHTEMLITKNIRKLFY